MNKIPNEIDKTIREIKIIRNLINSYSKYVSEQKDYLHLMVTITFGSNERINLLCKNNRISEKEALKMQYESLMNFIEKLRKTKLIKNKIYYFASFELQQSGDLHTHISLNIHKDDLISFAKFIYSYKNRKHKTLQIGRTHIGLSSYWKQSLDYELSLKEQKDKTDNQRVYYYSLDTDNYEKRKFESGEMTFWEFVSVNDLKERYNDKIENYLIKTVVGQIDTKSLKIGLNKAWNEHNLKNILNDTNLFEINNKFINEIKKIRSIGQVYTYNRLPFPFKVYQKYWSKLIAINKSYKSYYAAIKDYLKGILHYNNTTVFYKGKAII